MPSLRLSAHSQAIHQVQRSAVTDAVKLGNAAKKVFCLCNYVLFSPCPLCAKQHGNNNNEELHNYIQSTRTDTVGCPHCLMDVLNCHRCANMIECLFICMCACVCVCVCVCGVHVCVFWRFNGPLKFARKPSKQVLVRTSNQMRLGQSSCRPQSVQKDVSGR